MFMKHTIAKLLKKHAGLKEQEIVNLIEIPPFLDIGDYAFPCFTLAKKLKKSPQKIAENIKLKIKKLPHGIESCETEGAYLNFKVDKKLLAEKTVKEVLLKKDKFGKVIAGKKKKIMIEFSQANTHKAFHVGHIRGTSIGESLARISEFLGNKVIRANYQGDTGMHVAKWIWCYKKYHAKEKLKNDESWIASIYVDAVKKLNENPDLQLEVDEVNRKLESKSDKKLNELWRKTRKLSLNAFEKIYKELNTHFDRYFFEREFEKTGKKIVNDLIKKNLAEISEGATIINLRELGIWVLLRGDGTILYSAKDLGLAEKKFKEFNLDKSFYVIANEQDLHMKQLIKTLELLKFKNVNKINHVSYNLVKLPTGKMSSRTGDNILYSDFLQEIIAFAKKGILNRSPKISKKELEKRALKISIAAIKYSMLKQNPNRVIIFNKQSALNFEGDTGPYLLYSYARASSILKKAKGKKVFKIKNLKEQEIKLVKKLSDFSDVVVRAYNNLNPSLIANYSYQLSQIFNEFYHSCPVLDSEHEGFRISLVKSFRQVLKNSLNLLGIDVVEAM